MVAKNSEPVFAIDEIMVLLRKIAVAFDRLAQVGLVGDLPIAII